MLQFDLQFYEELTAAQNCQIYQRSVFFGRQVSLFLNTCDLFINGILDENHINQELVYKQNMYAEIMTVKDVLRPYQQHLIQMENISS